MKSKGLLIVLSLAFAGKAKAQALEITSNVAIAGDCASTIYALRNPTLGEDNPLLGVRPSATRVIAWCAIAVGANEGLTRLVFPHNNKMRNVVWGVISVVELWHIQHNLKIGGMIRF